MDKFEEVYLNIISEAKISKTWTMIRLWNVIDKFEIKQKFNDEITGKEIKRLMDVNSLVQNISKKDYNNEEVANQIVDALKNVCKLK